MIESIHTGLFCPSCGAEMEGFDDNGKPFKLQYDKRWEIAGQCPYGCQTYGWNMWTETSLKEKQRQRERSRV